MRTYKIILYFSLNAGCTVLKHNLLGHFGASGERFDRSFSQEIFRNFDSEFLATTFCKFFLVSKFEFLKGILGL